MTEWYTILEVDEYDTFDIIRKKYKELALKYHPDKNPETDTSEKFKTILDAYQLGILSAPRQSQSPSQTKNYYESTDEILDFLLNLRKVDIKIKSGTLKNLVISYNIVPFKCNKQSYIDMIFKNISQNDLILKLKILNLNIDGSFNDLVQRFLFGKCKSISRSQLNI
jgi:hypothetical protein